MSVYQADEIRLWAHVPIPLLRFEAAIEYKFLIRRGIPDAKRRQLWLATSGAAQLLQQRPKFYHKTQKTVKNNIFLIWKYPLTPVADIWTAGTASESQIRSVVWSQYLLVRNA